MDKERVLRWCLFNLVVGIIFAYIGVIFIDYLIAFPLIWYSIISFTLFLAFSYIALMDYLEDIYVN